MMVCRYTLLVLIYIKLTNGASLNVNKVNGQQCINNSVINPVRLSYEDEELGLKIVWFDFELTPYPQNMVPNVSELNFQLLLRQSATSQLMPLSILKSRILIQETVVRFEFDVRNICTTVYFEILARKCGGKTNATVAASRNVQLQRSLLKKLEKSSFITVARGSSGEILLENMNQFKVMKEFNCSNSIKFWISTEKSQVRISEKKEILIQDLADQTSIRFKKTMCNEVNRLKLYILPKLNFTQGNSSGPVDDCREIKMLINNSLEFVKSNFTWKEEGNKLILVDLLDKFYEDCFRFVFYNTNSKWTRILKTNMQFEFHQKSYCEILPFKVMSSKRIIVHPQLIQLEFRAQSQTIALKDLGAYGNCDSLTVMIECYQEGNPENVFYEVSFSKSEDFQISTTYFTNEYCRLRDFNQTYVYFSLSNTSIKEVMAVSVSLAVVLVLGAGIVFLVYKKKKNKNKNKLNSQETVKASQVFTNFLQNTDLIVKEFERLEKYAEDEITAKETFDEGRNKINVKNKRNRYKDVIPFDSNVVILSKPKGDPPLTYVNASEIRFQGIQQLYLAVQAPRPKAISSFWQMVFEKKVGIILMITKLVENGQKKADRYWPDKNEGSVIFEGMKIVLLKETIMGTYTSRSLVVEDKDQRVKKRIMMIHCTSWPDMTVPEDPKLLIDLIYSVEINMEKYNGTLLVLCSSGVCHTGTFIAVHKLYKELFKNESSVPSVYDTVIAMRSQRMKMVQTVEQYIYVFKCVKELATRIESGHYY